MYVLLVRHCRTAERPYGKYPLEPIAGRTGHGAATGSVNRAAVLFNCGCRPGAPRILAAASKTSAATPGRMSLAFESDALLVRTTSGAGRPVRPAGRCRGGGQPSAPWGRGLGRSQPCGRRLLTPFVEVALLRDGGDAETVFGVEFGGGLAFADTRAACGSR